MPELPHRNLDTGMGLERMAAIMQHKTANYDGDLMQHLIKLGEKISGKTYDFGTDGILKNGRPLYADGPGRASYSRP